MKKFKTLVALPIIIAGFAFAPNASAAVSMPIVPGSYTSEGPLGGAEFQAAIPTGWNLSSCSGKGYQPSQDGSSWIAVPGATLLDDGVESNAVWLYWNNIQPTSSSPFAHLTYSCQLWKNKVTYPLKWKKFTQHRSGTNTSSRSHSSSCYTDGYSGELHLDCWGGAYAQASYHFALPRDARVVGHHLSVDPGCCNPGTVNAYWSGHTGIVRVTNWKSAWVSGASITYWHRVPTRTVTKIYTTGVGQF